MGFIHDIELTHEQNWLGGSWRRLSSFIRTGFGILNFFYMYTVTLFVCSITGIFIWYFLGKLSKEDKIDFVYPSELSNPSINIPPYGFYAPHYRLLENFSYYSWSWNPEFTHFQVNSWEKSNDRRAGELAKMGFLNVRSEKTLRWKRNYYSINKKGRDALNLYNSKF